MRKLIFAIGAIALLGLTAGCTDPVENNPNYDAATNSVMTNFVFNVATGNTPQTKQSAATVQYDINNDSNVSFRGIGDSWLLTLKNSAGDGNSVASAVQMDDALELGQVLGQNALKPASSSTTDKKSNRILQISLPVNTNSLVFYGKALRAAQENYNAEGQVSYDPITTKNLADVKIHLVPRVPTGSADASQMEYIAKVIEKALNQITEKVLPSGSGPYSGGGQAAISLTNDLKWADYAQCIATEGTNAGKSPVQTSEDAGELEKILARSFKSFTTITVGPDGDGDSKPDWTEVRSGAGKALARQLSDLYAVLTDVVGATPVASREAAAQGFANALLTELNKFMDLSHNSWGQLATVISNLTTPPASVTISDVNRQDLNKFPSSFDLPAGATQIYYETTSGTQKEFKYKLSEIPLPAMGGKTTSVYKYLYPAELCYFGNSPIRTTDSSTDTYPDGVDAWDTDVWTGSWQKNTHVTSSTRSVAMRDNINYSTALLKSTIGYADNIPVDNGVYYLLDNNANIPGHNPTTDVANHIPLSSTSFQLTGLLIGGASKDFDWCFIPQVNADQETYIIYDKSIGSTGTGIYVPNPTGTTATTSEDVFTMVFDNYVPIDATTTEQSSVFVALEFLNNSGKDFWGLGNMVRDGGTFYIIGVLNPNIQPGTSTPYATAEAGINWPTHYALPPYANDGSTIQARRVFIQDYMTVANFKLGPNSLQSAYVTVPDLRSSKIQLGLSVDLGWTTGLNFGDIILGQ